MNMAELDCKINPVNTSEYPTKAKRPAYSVFAKNKIISDYNIVVPEWKVSLRKLIKEIENKKIVS